MIKKYIDDRLYIKSELLDGIVNAEHFFTTKVGGFSSGKISGLNLGFRVGDDAAMVKNNYIQLAKDFKLPFEKITAAKQIHSADIKIVTEEDAGCGVSRLDEIFEADALVTNCKNLPIMVFYADCVPILLADDKAGVIAAVHSGWRGTVARIVENAVCVMKEKFGARPENIKAAIGPSIGMCCFETGAEVACEFDKELVEKLSNGKFKVDLWSANRELLINSGVKEEHIDVAKMCTICHSDLLYSYRINGESTGRMGAVIMIKG